MKTLSAIFILLLFAACAQTTATKEKRPQNQETRQPAPTVDKTASPTAESEQQNSQTASKSGETASMDEAADQKPDEISAPAVESESKKFEEKSSTDQQVSARDSADARLTEARENLRVSRETEERIAGELEQLKKSGGASDDAIRDYEAYLKSVQAMTAENRKIVAQMEAAYAKQTPGDSRSDASSANGLDELADPDIPEEQSIDEVAALDRQLNESLAKFDGVLLREMDEIRAESAEKLQDLAEEAADAAKRLREKGLDVDTSGSKSSKEGRQGENAREKAGRETGSATDRTGTDAAARDGARKGGPGLSNKNQRRASYEDDDIVARQLREAAENETDPELKEKLWREYEEYKKNR